MILTTSLNNATLAGTGQGGPVSALTPEQDTMLKEIWERQGLNPANPLTATPDLISTQDSSIVMDITGDGETIATVTRR